MDVREKLVELLKRADRDVYEELKDREDYREEMLWDYFASNLIANGVTVQEDCRACAEATQNCIVKLQEQIAKLRSVQEWISVKDRLPEKNEFDWVLVVVELHSQYGIFHSVPIVAELRHGEWYDYNDETIEGEFEKVTHWMPLPQPPKGE